MSKKQSNPPPPVSRDERPKPPPAPPRIQYEFCPYLREIIDCFDMDSPVREIIVKKGCSVGPTTSLKDL